MLENGPTVDFLVFTSQIKLADVKLGSKLFKRKVRGEIIIDIAVNRGKLLFQSCVESVRRGTCIKA